MRFHSLILQALVASAGLGFASLAVADGQLPAAIIRVPASTTTLFVAETSSNRFYRFDREETGIVANGSFYMSIGQKGAGKERSGDQRTPLGVYFVTEQLDTSRLHEKYGVTAFPLDYPNAWDELAERDGDGIWVHGVLPGAGRRPERDTDGCIALPNEDLSKLAPAFADNITPVVVTEEVIWVDAAENRALEAELMRSLEVWAASQQAGDVFTWLSLYSDEFERWGMNKDEWSALHVATERLDTIRKVEISDILLVAYPEEDGLYVSRFLAEIADGESTVTKRTRLYWRRHADGTLKIVAQDSG